MSLPIYQNFLPSKNFPGAIPHTDIYFEVVDPDGININTLTILINSNQAVVNGVFQPGFSGALTKVNPAGTQYNINVNPDVNFLFGDNITIGAKVEDLLGNVGNEFYSFTIIDNPDNMPPSTIPVPRGGIFNTSQSITLEVYDASTTTTFYTLDGTDPITNGNLYTGPISLSSEGSFTLKFYSRDNNNSDSSDDNIEAVQTEIYTLDFTAPVTSVNIQGGTYLTPQIIELSTNEPATIYYTLDGSTPTTSSLVYTQPINIGNEGNTILRYFAVDLAGNVENIQTQTYIISYAKSNFAPSNVMVISPYIRGKLDIVWDNMEMMDDSVTGYNVYRSYFLNGPYTKINNTPIRTTEYRDEATDVEIVEEDVSSQFQRTTEINRYASDHFDGNTIDKTKWIESDIIEVISQYNSLIFCDPLGQKANSNLKSLFKFNGDFDIQIGLDLIAWNTPDTIINEIGFGVTKANGDKIVISRKKSQTQDVLESAIYINGTPDLPIITTNNQTIITLRITRNGNSITTSFLDSSGSTVIHHTFNSFEDDLYALLYVKTADVPLEARMYDFIVNSGNAVIVKPLNPQHEYVIKTSKRPIVDDVIDPTGNTKDVDLYMSPNTNQREYVTVTIDGIKAKIKAVYGLEGEIVIDTQRYWDDIDRVYYQPPVPNEESVVKVTYSYRYHDVDYSLRKPLYYKVTLEHSCGETDLRYARPASLHGDGLDYLYAEGLRRNKWMLDQAGERVLLFVKSKAGQRCECYLRNERTHRQAHNKCDDCYGTGFIPPYADPVCITISPAMSEQKLLQTDRGMRLDYVTEVWTITPHIITQRDFLVRRDGTILGIGGQTAPEVRGRRLDQQHFNIQPIDRSDVRYDYLEKVSPYDNRRKLKLKCEGIRTESNVDCADVDTKGRTIAFGNIMGF